MPGESAEKTGYLGEDGQIVKSAKIDEYYVDDEGKMVTNAWVELKNEEDPDSPETPDTFWYYFEKDGKSAVSKWVKFDSKWYYSMNPPYGNRKDGD